ncbi:MAG TPA: hypothetical protein VFV99_29260 [Kofleriaceae bacterium]|nr:hypothetical protein [Kofleriaceae bacterium]
MRGFACAALVLVACGRLRFDPISGADGDGGIGDGSGSAGPDAPLAGFSHVVAAHNQTCALYRDNKLYCWGNSPSGEVGVGVFGQVLVPTPYILPAGHVDDFSTGGNRSCAIVDGTVYCAGNMESPAQSTPKPYPTPFPATRIGAGDNFVCALSAGAVYCWGDNDLAQLGVGDTGVHASWQRLAFTGDPTIVALEVGDKHACAIDTTNTVWCWGDNNHGSLGTGSTSPAVVAIPTKTLATIRTLPQIAGWHACSLEAGIVRCWGEGDNGELGDGNTNNSATPVTIPTLSGVTVLSTGGGVNEFDASCVSVAGDVKCWGLGMRLGAGNTSPSSVPVTVNGLPGPAVELALGNEHACARLVDGDLWCWGRGVHGQLGDGLQTTSANPVLVVRPP